MDRKERGCALRSFGLPVPSRRWLEAPWTWGDGPAPPLTAAEHNGDETLSQSHFTA